MVTGEEEVPTFEINDVILKHRHGFGSPRLNSLDMLKLRYRYHILLLQPKWPKAAIHRLGLGVVPIHNLIYIS